MANRRMFSREIFSSTVMLNLAAANPAHELAAQRVWEALILLADDHGRLRFDPAIIRMEAFKSTPNTHASVGLDLVSSWLTQLERDGCIAIYEAEGGRYCVLTKWDVHQGGTWRRANSDLPEPPPEILARCFSRDSAGKVSRKVSEKVSEYVPEKVSRKVSGEVKLREVKLNKDVITEPVEKPKKPSQEFLDWMYLEYQTLNRKKPGWPIHAFSLSHDLYDDLVTRIDLDTIKAVALKYLKLKTNTDETKFWKGHPPNLFLKNFHRFYEDFTADKPRYEQVDMLA